MDSAQNPVPLVGREIHGFQTLADLNVGRLMEQAAFRWFRPNEVNAILSNYTHFKIQPQPVDKPTSGSVLLFDRKVLRNFRNDGHNWRKKKDGKNVQEAHEKLKIGNEERVHVYYARSEDDPNFHRRSYWLLDKNLERIVLVHYRQTEEYASPHPPLPVERTDPFSLIDMTNYSSPLTPMNSSSGSAHSDLSGSAVFSEEINPGEEQAFYIGSSLYPVKEHTQAQNLELNLHDVNSFEWKDLVDPPEEIAFGSYREGYVPSGQQRQSELSNCPYNDSFLSSNMISSSGHSIEAIDNNGFDGVKQVSSGYSQTGEGQKSPSPLFTYVNPHSQATGLNSSLVGSSETPEFTVDDILTSQNSFGGFSYMNDESLSSLDGLQFDAPISNAAKSDAFTIMDHSSTEVPIFNIMDFSPGWAYATVETKILVVGSFYESYKHPTGCNAYFVFGGTCIAAEVVQDGVYSCTTLSHSPGIVDFFLTFDCNTSVSQVLSFEYRSMPSLQSNGGLSSSEKGKDKLNKTVNQEQIRLAHLLFSTTNTMSILSNKIQPRSLKEAQRYASLSSPFVEKDWTSLLKLRGDVEISYVEHLFELFLKSKLQEWLFHKVAEGCKVTAYDSQGQGVIHLCAILDYAWAVRLFSLSGFSLDFRDAFGWTALHWAAYCGREKLVASLLSAGANPSLVTDPTPENPGGYTAADLASKGGYEGLSAYLAEKGLIAHFQAMKLSGNIAAPLPPTSNNVVNSETVYSEKLSEQELCLKESLAAYRNAADAADRIQAAFRERTFKQQTKAIQLVEPEMEAAQIVAALRIQHAFRNYSRRRLMKAAARIQSHFRTWQTRKNFLYMRRQAIRIQAAFRGHQVRWQYHKIIWSVGVLEKAVLRWRLKRKGLRGIQTENTQAMRVDKEQEEYNAEENFFRIGREQAEERIKSSVIKVQSLFRSYQAQQEYRRMKLAHEQAKLEFNQDGSVGDPGGYR